MDFCIFGCCLVWDVDYDVGGICVFVFVWVYVDVGICVVVFE